MIVQPGSISTATLRTSDLIVAFLDALPPAMQKHFRAEYGEVIDWAEVETAHVMTETEEPEDAAYFLNEVLVDALDDIAPDGYYFGAHPGDGADFGFWPIEDEDESED